MLFLRGIPFLNNLSFAVKDLDVRSFNFLSVRYVDLAYAYLGLGILDQDHSVFGHGSGRRYLSALVDREGRLRCDRVAIRCNGFFQRIGTTSFNTLNNMYVCSGIPLIDDNSVAVNYLDMRISDFFTVCSIDLGNIDSCIGKCCLRCAVLGDCSSCSGTDYYKSIIVRFSYGIAYCYRQSGGCFALTICQCKCSNALIKGHLAISSVNCRIFKGNSKGK